MAGLYDDSGIMVDPVTGQIISAPQTNTAGPGIGDALSGLRTALLPPGSPPAAPPAAPQAQLPPAPPMAPPQAAPGAPPDAAQQLAAVGLPPSGQPAPGAVQGAQEGLPPGSAQVADGAMPVPPIPPAAPPPVAAPDPTARATTDQAPVEAPDGVSNNYRNNPLNLRYAKQDGATNVNGFAAFSTPEEGIAAAKNQFSINAGRGINTLTGLVSSWAPPNENDTAAYITTVSKATGIDPNAKIDLNDPAIQAKLIPAMSLVENGPLGKNGARAVTAAGPGTPAGQMADQMTLANASTPVPGASPPSGPQDGSSPFQIPFPNVGQPNRQNQLLAVASGLLGGKTLGQGLGKGLENLVGVNSQTQNQQMQVNAQAQERQRMAQQQQYQNGMLGNALQKTTLQGNKPAGPPVMVQNPDGTTSAQIRLTDGTTVPLPGVTAAMINAGTSQQRLGLANRALDLKNDPTQLARLTQDKVAAVSAQKDQDTVYAAQPQEQLALQEVNQTQALMGQHPELMGSTLQNKWSQLAASLGLSGEAADYDALQKMTTDQRNKALSTLTNGHVGGIRSNAELTNISKAFPSVGTQPAAANYIMEGIKTQLQANAAWRDELTRRQQEDPASITGRNYNPTKSQFFTAYGKANPLPDYQSPSGTSSPAPSAPGSVASNATPPGVSKVLRYDAKGNLVQ